MKDFYKKNYYELFNLDKDCSQSDIKKAFYKLAKQYHPDVCKDNDAIEKFKHINEAYQTLINENTKKDYDLFLSKNDINSFKNNSFFDVTILDPIMKSSKFNYGQIENIYSNLSMDEKLLIYEYFWLSLWNGNAKTEFMISNKVASKIFKYFADKSELKTVYDNILSNSSYNDRKTINELYENFQSSINTISFNVEQNMDSVKIYNYVVDIINDDNIFDNPLCSFIAIKIKMDVIKMIELIENIFDKHKSKLDIEKRNSEDQKISHKKSFSISAVILVVIVITLILIFIF